MEFTGKLIRIVKDYSTGGWAVTFSINEDEALEASNSLIDKLLSVKATVYRKKRSIDSNALFWACVTQIANVTHQDKWDVYLQKVKAHGKCYPVTVIKEGLADLQATWRETEVVGEWTDELGITKCSVLCYPGTHLYNTKEFSSLLEDVIEDMKDLGLQPPTSQEMQRSLEEWEKRTAH